MKYLLLILVFCHQISIGQNSSTDTINNCGAKLNYLKPIDNIKEEIGKTKLDKREDAILSKYKKAEIGTKAYDFTAINAKGDSVRFSDIDSGLKLLVFTSAFCRPCIKALEELKYIQKTYAHKLTIMSFYLNQSKEDWLHVIKEQDISWLCLWDGQARFSNTVIKYGVKKVPMFFVIDSEGKILDLWAGYHEGSIINRINDKDVGSNYNTL